MRGSEQAFLILCSHPFDRAREVAVNMPGVNDSSSENAVPRLDTMCR